MTEVTEMIKTLSGNIAKPGHMVKLLIDNRQSGYSYLENEETPG